MKETCKKACNKEAKTAVRRKMRQEIPELSEKKRAECGSPAYNAALCDVHQKKREKRKRRKRRRKRRKLQTETDKSERNSKRKKTL